MRDASAMAIIARATMTSIRVKPRRDLELFVFPATCLEKTLLIVSHPIVFTLGQALQSFFDFIAGNAQAHFKGRAEL